MFEITYCSYLIVLVFLLFQTSACLNTQPTSKPKIMRCTNAPLLVLVILCCCAWAMDPDVYRNFTQIIESKGYKVQQHDVQTQDGYILTVFRMPPKEAHAPAVLLQHGLLDCSFTWILNFPHQSLPYLLVDAGYDVWMGNNRGNNYSLAHTVYPVDSKQFWDFSFDDMAKYDIPAMIQYIKQVSGVAKISYVGHSQGTVQMFAALTSNPQVARDLNFYGALAPVARVGSETNVFLRTLATIHLQTILAIFGENRFLPNSRVLDKYFAWMCNLTPGICDSVVELICGKHKGAFNNSRMSVMASHEPSGTSLKDAAHWAQLVMSNKFRMYDYGPDGNMKHYNNSEPPIYDLTLFQTDPALQQLPIYLSYGGQDELADLKDVKWLLQFMPSSSKADLVPEYAHLDFVWATDANTKVYAPMMRMMQQFAH